MEDDHVDRLGVEVRQRMKLTSTNSSIGFIILIACAHLKPIQISHHSKYAQKAASFSITMSTPIRRRCCALPTWWFWRGGCTRSHSEHGRETPQRRWYFVLRRGRVGRCQVCKTQHIHRQSSHNNKQPKHNAGWSSPVARQAHNLKAAGSNPAPATTDNDKPVASAAGFVVFAAFPMACRSVHSRIVANSPCSVA